MILHWYNIAKNERGKTFFTWYSGSNEKIKGDGFKGDISKVFKVTGL